MVLIFSGSSDSNTTAPKSAPASESKSDASAEKVEKKNNEAENAEENPVDLDNLNYEYDPNQWNDNPEEEGAAPDAGAPPAENN